MKHPSHVESDRIFIDIDTRGRGQDSFHFEVTSGGSFVDGIRYNDVELDKQWDGNWDAAVSRDESGYTVEVQIPLRLLRRPPNESEPVHLQVRRYISKLGELDEWAPTPRDNSREVSAYRPVTGLVLPPRRFALDLLPYVSVGGELASAPDARVPNAQQQLQINIHTKSLLNGQLKIANKGNWTEVVTTKMKRKATPTKSFHHKLIRRTRK